MVLADGEVLTERDLPQHIADASQNLPSPREIPVGLTMEELEKLAITKGAGSVQRQPHACGQAPGDFRPHVAAKAPAVRTGGRQQGTNLAGHPERGLTTCRNIDSVAKLSRPGSHTTCVPAAFAFDVLEKAQKSFVRHWLVDLAWRLHKFFPSTASDEGAMNNVYQHGSFQCQWSI